MMYQNLPLSLSQMSLNKTGLLSEQNDPFTDPNKLGLLSAASALLAASGPSTTPTNFGQAAGQGLSGYMQGRQAGIENLRNKEIDDFNRKYKEAQMNQMLKGSGLIGDITPGNYTPESLSAFHEDYLKNMRPNYSLLKESVNPFRAGGVTYAVGPDGKPVPLIDPATVAANAGGISAAQAAGAETGKAQGQAVTSLGGMEDLENQLVRIMADPNFSGAVGFFDQFTGKAGEAQGTKEGVLGGEIERVSNKLVADAADKWKGAISDKELEMFRASVPTRGSSDATWKHWYTNEYLPMKQRVEATAIKGQGATQAAGRVRRYNPATGRIE